MLGVIIMGTINNRVVAIQINVLIVYTNNLALYRNKSNTVYLNKNAPIMGRFYF